MTYPQSLNPPWRRRTAVVGGLLIAVVAVAAFVMGDRVPPLDTWIAGNLYSRPETAPAVAATVISGVATLLGFALLLAAAVSLLWRYRGRGAKLLARCGLLLVLCLVTLALQGVFRRSGPPVTAQDWTYPSGHVTVLTALAFTTFAISAYLAPAWRTAVLIAGTTMLVAVSASRVTLGEHYLVDTVAALLATLGVGLLATVVLGLPPRSSTAVETRIAT